MDTDVDNDSAVQLLVRLCEQDSISLIQEEYKVNVFERHVARLQYEWSDMLFIRNFCVVLTVVLAIIIAVVLAMHR